MKGNIVDKIIKSDLYLFSYCIHRWCETENSLHSAD